MTSPPPSSSPLEKTVDAGGSGFHNIHNNQKVTEDALAKDSVDWDIQRNIPLLPESQQPLTNDSTDFQTSMIDDSDHDMDKTRHSPDLLNDSRSSSASQYLRRSKASKSPGIRERRRRKAAETRSKNASNSSGSATLDKSVTMTTDDSNLAVASRSKKRVSKDSSTTDTTSAAAAAAAAAFAVVKTPPKSSRSSSKKYIYSPPTREIIIPLTGSSSSSSSDSPTSKHGDHKQNRRSRRGNFRHRQEKVQDEDDDDDVSSSELAAKNSNRSLSSGVSALTLPTSLEFSPDCRLSPQKTLQRSSPMQNSTGTGGVMHQLPSVPTRYISSEISDTDQTSSPKTNTLGAAMPAAILLLQSTSRPDQQPTLQTPPVSFNANVEEMTSMPKSLKYKTKPTKKIMTAAGEVTPPRLGKRNVSQPTPPLRKRSINGDVDLSSDSDGENASISDDDVDRHLAEHLPVFPVALKDGYFQSLNLDDDDDTDDEAGYDAIIANAVTNWPSRLQDVMSSPIARTSVGKGGEGRWKLEPRSTSRKKDNGDAKESATMERDSVMLTGSSNHKMERRLSSLERKKPERQHSGNTMPTAAVAASISRMDRQAVNETIASIVSPKKTTDPEKADNAIDSGRKDKISLMAEANRGRRRFLRSERSRSNPRRSITPSRCQSDEQPVNPSGELNSLTRRAPTIKSSHHSLSNYPTRPRSMTPPGIRNAPKDSTQQEHQKSSRKMPSKNLARASQTSSTPAVSGKSNESSDDDVDPLSMHGVKRYDSIELAKGLKPKGERRPRKVMPSIDWSPSHAMSPSNRSLSPDRIFEPTYSLGSFTKRLAQSNESKNHGSHAKNASIASHATPTTANCTASLTTFLDDSSAGNALSTHGGSQRSRSQRSTMSLSAHLSANLHRPRSSSGQLSVNSFSPPSKPPVHPSSTRSLQSSASSRPPLTSPSTSTRSGLRSSLHSLGSSMGSLRSVGSASSFGGVSERSDAGGQNEMWATAHTRPPSRGRSPSRQEIVRAMEQRSRQKLAQSMAAFEREESWRKRREQSKERVRAILLKDGGMSDIAVPLGRTKVRDSSGYNDNSASSAAIATNTKSTTIASNSDKPVTKQS